VRSFVVTRAELDSAALAGTVLCHGLRSTDGDVQLRKGHILRAEDVEVLAGLDWGELHLVAMDSGDVHEDEAGERVAHAAAGEGVAVRGQSAGHWSLEARTRGIVDVKLQALERVNGIEGLCVYTLYSGHVIDAGEVVARAKVTPFVIDGAPLREAESVAREVRGLVHVRPFQPTSVGAVVQESLGGRALRTFEHSLGEKIRWMGSTLGSVQVVAPREDAVRDALQSQLDAGVGVIVVAGAKAMDNLDPAFRALEYLGAEHVRHGVPAHPGSLFWLARLNGVPVMGMPTCGLFSQATVFDLVLPRVLVGDRLGAPELASLGHGGFLTRDMTFRFPPYREAQRRGELEEEMAD
jgi:hypothetical protein